MENTETNKSEERFCNRCGCKIEVEKELDYPFYCPNCDENMFKFETHTKKYGYAYVDEGDSADGYPRVNEILFDTKDEARREMMKDVRTIAAQHNCDNTDIHDEGDGVWIADVCSWKIFDVRN